MTEYYKINENLKAYIESLGIINKVTNGRLSDIDIEKREFLPLAHIMIGGGIIEERTITFNIDILFGDIVRPIEKHSERNEWLHPSNIMDVHNTTFSAANMVSQALLRGELYGLYFQIINAPQVTKFEERFESDFAGWVLSADIVMPNNQICVDA